MKCYKPLRDKFNRLDTSIRDWVPKSGFPRSRDTASVIVNRDEPVEPMAIVYMAHCLGYSNREIIGVLDDYAREIPKYKVAEKELNEIYLLRKLIVPVDTTPEEQTIIGKLRRLDGGKRKLVLDMVNSLGG